MSAIALQYHHKPGSSIFLVIEATEIAAAKVLYNFVRVLSKTPWIFALLLLITGGLLYTLIFYIPLYLSRKTNTIAVNKTLASLSELNDRDAMLYHSDIEQEVKKLNFLTENTAAFFVFKPLNNEFARILEDLKRLEVALFNQAYPSADNKLTSDQEAELIKAFKPWKQGTKEVALHG